MNSRVLWSIKFKTRIECNTKIHNVDELKLYLSNFQFGLKQQTTTTTITATVVVVVAAAAAATTRTYTTTTINITVTLVR